MSERSERWLTYVSLALGVVNLGILASTFGRAAYHRLVRGAWIDPLTGETRQDVKAEASRYMQGRLGERAGGLVLTFSELARDTFEELGRTRPGPADLPEVNAIVWPDLKAIARRECARAQTEGQAERCVEDLHA